MPLAAERHYVRPLDHHSVSESTQGLSGLCGNCGRTTNVRQSLMASNPLTELLKLPAGDRADLAMSLWESLSDVEREGGLELGDQRGGPNSIDAGLSTSRIRTATFPGRWFVRSFAARTCRPRSSFGPRPKARRSKLATGTSRVVLVWANNSARPWKSSSGGSPETPFAFPRIHGETRRAVLGRFP